MENTAPKNPSAFSSSSANSNSSLHKSQKDPPKPYVNPLKVGPLHVPRPYSKAQFMGGVLDGHSYPVEKPVNNRLLCKFGKPYRNSCIFPFGAQNRKVNIRNGWGTDTSSMALSLTVDHEKRTLPLSMRRLMNSRCFAINESDGRLAMLFDDCFLAIYSPNGSCGYQCEIVFNVPKHTEREWDNRSDEKGHRVRFVGNNVYIFHSRLKKIYCLAYDAVEKEVIKLDTLYDAYFLQARVVDFVINGAMLMVLFDKWVGTYTIYPTLSWYHAVAFSKSSKRASSFEVATYDDWEDRMDDPLEREWITQQIQRQHNKQNVEDQINSVGKTLQDLYQKKQKIDDEISKLEEKMDNLEWSGTGSITEQRGKALLAVTLAREEIVCVTNEQWSLVTETENASRALEVAMCAVLTLLGLHGVTTWSSVKDALQAENANIFQRIRECKLQDIVKEDCITAEALLDGIDDVQLQIENEDLEGDESGEISKVLCKWATAHIEYTSVNLVYEEIESQIAIQKVKREEIKTQIEVEYARKKTIEEEWERSLCRKQEYEWNDAHRVKDENQEEEEKQSEVNEE